MKLPFVMPSPFGFQKRVLAHRVPSFPLSIGNQPATADYYQTQYLTVGGEGGKHAQYGGFLRQRPLPVAAALLGQAQLQMEQEVAMAIAQGMTGFCMDIQGVADGASATGSVGSMSAAATAVDSRFWVFPKLDMNALVGLTQAQAVSILTQCNTYPNVARLPDGRMLFSAFDAPIQPLAWWTSLIAALNAQNIDVAFLPVFLGDPASNPLASISYGFAGWGTATAAAAQSRPSCTMMPILSQQFRPDDACFWEAANFDTFIAGWMAAINANAAELVQIVTWNDFSESGQVQPCTDATLVLNIGNGFASLCAYYATWFMQGTQPPITKDVLYWCYRKMPSIAVRNLTQQPDAFTIVQPGIEVDQIEMLAFLNLSLWRAGDLWANS